MNSRKNNIINNLIYSPITVAGAWSDHPDQLNQKDGVYFGNFQADSENGTLKLFEMNDDKSLYKNREIYGHTLNNEYIHLYNIWGTPYTREGTIDFQDNVSLSRENLLSNFFSVSNIKFGVEQKTTKLIIDISGLNLWLPELFKPELYDPYLNSKTKGKYGILYSVDVANQEIGKFMISDKVYTLSLRENLKRTNRTLKNYSFNGVTSLMISSPQGINEKEAVKIACSLERLFILILGLKLDLNHVYLLNSNRVTALFPLFDHQPFKIKYSRNEFIENLSPWEAIKDRLSDIFRSWFIRSSELSNLVTNYNQTILFNYSTSMEFITLMSGIENFFIDFHSSLHRELLALIFNMPIPYLNYLDDKLVKFSGLVKWIRDLVDTRVYYTHGTLRKHRITDEQDLIRSTKILKLVIQAFCLQQLGFLVPLNRFKMLIDQAWNTEIIPNEINL